MEHLQKAVGYRHVLFSDGFVSGPYVYISCYCPIVLQSPDFSSVETSILKYKSLNLTQIKVASVRKYTEKQYKYFITTSGTTGVPKIVMVPRSCIEPNISDFWYRCWLNADEY